MEKFKNSILGSVVILGSICFVVVLLLSLTNKITAPIIEANTSSLPLEDKLLLLPEAEGFENIVLEEDIEGINSVEKATNDVGYIFETVVVGYGGEFKTIVAINQDGEITGIKILDHGETPGLGTKVFDEKNLEKYYETSTPEDVDMVAGATVTSSALTKALSQAVYAYSQMGGQ